MLGVAAKTNLIWLLPSGCVSLGLLVNQYEFELAEKYYL